MNNSKNALMCFFWPVFLIVQVLWLLVKIMTLAFIRADDYRECERMSYKNPKKVTYGMRQGMALTRFGQWLLFMVAAILCIVMINCVW